MRVGEDDGGCTAGRSMELVKRYVRILTWLPRYTRSDALGDLVAGVTLGLTMIPQSIACASLMGLTAEYGLYSSFMGGLVYMVFGTIKEASIGITLMVSLVTFEYTHDLPTEFVFLLTLLSGCVQLLMGLLNLGILVDFISVPVTSGFTSAAAIIVVTSQMKGLLGLQGFQAHNFVDNVLKLAHHAHETRLWDAVLGAVCIVLLLVIRKMKDIRFGPKQVKKQTSLQRLVNKFFWFFSISRNAFVVLICSLIAFKYGTMSMSPFTLTGTIPEGLPRFGPPPFSINSGNTTYTFLQMCEQLGLGIVVVPVVSVLANVAIAKAFSSGMSLDATHEMLTLGLCNIFGSFVQSVPTTGAFSRSAVSNASGVRTPMAGLYSAMLILLALSYLTPHFYYIPRAALSAVLISAVMFMADFGIMLQLWRKSKRDLLALLLTLLICLMFGVEIGLLIGTLFSAAQLLYYWARPVVAVANRKSKQGGEYVLVTPDIGLLYPAVDYLRTELGRVVTHEARRQLPVVINCAYLKGFDFTAAEGLKIILNDFKLYQLPLVFINVHQNVLDLMQKNGLNDIQHAKSEKDVVEMLFGNATDIEKGDATPIENGSQETYVLLENETEIVKSSDGRTDYENAARDDSKTPKL